MVNAFVKADDREHGSYDATISAWEEKTRALGHPVGCSGARIVVTLVHQMKRQNATRGMASMCIGVGQGITSLLEGT